MGIDQTNIERVINLIIMPATLSNPGPTVMRAMLPVATVWRTESGLHGRAAWRTGKLLRAAGGRRLSNAASRFRAGGKLVDEAITTPLV